jgi:hypothetical protein
MGAMRREFCCVLLVVAIVSAGCSGFATDGGSGEGKDGDPTVSVTPAPVPSVETRERLAPGLSDDGIENASALAAAHDFELRNRSFTLRMNQTVEYANGSLRGRTVGVVRVVPDGAAFRTNYTITGTPIASHTTDFELVRTERWFGGERGLAASTFANDTTNYDRFSAEFGSSIVRSFIDNGDRYARLLDGARTRVVGRTERDGKTFYRVAASDPSSTALARYPSLESAENATLEALVSSRGFVRAHRLAYRATTENGSTLRIVESVRYTDIGDTTVRRPPWYEEALRATNRTNATGSGG